MCSVLVKMVWKLASAPGATGKAAMTRSLPIFKSFAGFRLAAIGADVVAGITLAAVAIPEQMATARLGGLAPQIGFFAFIAATLAFAAFGSSRQVSAGADSTITPIFAGGLALLAMSGSPHYAALAAGLAVMVGVMVIVAGVFRMGWVGNLLSVPVTTGFLAGISVHIIVSQLPAAFGLAPLHGSTLSRMVALAGLAPHANPAALAIAAGVVAMVAVGHKVSARVPAPLVAVGLAAVVVEVLHLDRHGVALLGAVAGGLPGVSLPAVGIDDIVRLLPLASLVALVVMVQGAATARSFPPDAGAPDVNGDFIGLGTGSVLSGLCGAFPVNASPPRTAIVAESGGRSQVAGLTAVAITLLLLAFGTGVLQRIPEAALSGILLFVALRIFRIGQMRAVLRQSPAEILLIAATALAIVVLPIQDGVALGVALSLLQGVWNGARARLLPMGRIPGTTVWWARSNSPDHPSETVPGVVVVGFHAPLNFLNADGFAAQCLDLLTPGNGDPTLVVLEAAGLIDIDFTASQAIHAVVAACRAAGAVFALARLESPVAQAALDRLGLRALIGADHVFESVEAAVRALGPPAG